MNPFINPWESKPSVASRVIKFWLTVAGLSLPSGLVVGVFLGSMFWGCSYTRRAILPELPEIKVSITKPAK